MKIEAKTTDAAVDRLLQRICETCKTTRDEAVAIGQLAYERVSVRDKVFPTLQLVYSAALDIHKELSK